VLGGLVSSVYEFGLLVMLSMNEIGFIGFGLYFTGFNGLIWCGAYWVSFMIILLDVWLLDCWIVVLGLMWPIRV
jgi:hypothetical protein